MDTLRKLLLPSVAFWLESHNYNDDLALELLLVAMMDEDHIIEQVVQRHVFKAVQTAHPTSDEFMRRVDLSFYKNGQYHNCFTRTCASSSRMLKSNDTILMVMKSIVPPMTSFVHAFEGDTVAPQIERLAEQKAAYPERVLHDFPLPPPRSMFSFGASLSLNQDETLESMMSKEYFAFTTDPHFQRDQVSVDDISVTATNLFPNFKVFQVLARLPLYDYKGDARDSVIGALLEHANNCVRYFFTTIDYELDAEERSSLFLRCFYLAVHSGSGHIPSPLHIRESVAKTSKRVALVLSPSNEALCNFFTMMPNQGAFLTGRILLMLRQELKDSSSVVDVETLRNITALSKSSRYSMFDHSATFVSNVEIYESGTLPPMMFDKLTESLCQEDNMSMERLLSLSTLLQDDEEEDKDEEDEDDSDEEYDFDEKDDSDDNDDDDYNGLYNVWIGGVAGGGGNKRVMSSNNAACHEWISDVMPPMHLVHTVERVFTESGSAWSQLSGGEIRRYVLPELKSSQLIKSTSKRRRISMSSSSSSSSSGVMQFLTSLQETRRSQTGNSRKRIAPPTFVSSSSSRTMSTELMVVMFNVDVNNHDHLDGGNRQRLVSSNGSRLFQALSCERPMFRPFYPVTSDLLFASNKGGRRNFTTTEQSTSSQSSSSSQSSKRAAGVASMLESEGTILDNHMHVKPPTDSIKATVAKWIVPCTRLTPLQHSALLAIDHNFSNPVISHAAQHVTNKHGDRHFLLSSSLSNNLAQDVTLETSRNAVSMHASLLAMEVGTGKTLTVLTSIMHDSESNGGGVYLVCVPDALVGHWLSETNKHTKLSVLDGNVLYLPKKSSVKQGVITSAVNRVGERGLLIVIASFAAMRSKWFTTPTRIRAIAVDEAHLLKPRTIAYNALLHVQAHHVIAVTATPAISYASISELMGIDKIKSCLDTHTTRDFAAATTFIGRPGKRQSALKVTVVPHYLETTQLVRRAHDLMQHIGHDYIRTPGSLRRALRLYERICAGGNIDIELMTAVIERLIGSQEQLLQRSNRSTGRSSLRRLSRASPMVDVPNVPITNVDDGTIQRALNGQSVYTSRLAIVSCELERSGLPRPLNYARCFTSQNDDCTICLSSFDEPLQLSCGHVFCKTCLEAMVAIDRTQCPNCRSHLFGEQHSRTYYGAQPRRFVLVVWKPQWELDRHIVIISSMVVVTEQNKDVAEEDKTSDVAVITEETAVQTIQQLDETPSRDSTINAIMSGPTNTEYARILQGNNDSDEKRMEDDEDDADGEDVIKLAAFKMCIAEYLAKRKHNSRVVIFSKRHLPAKKYHEHLTKDCGLKVLLGGIFNTDRKTSLRNIQAFRNGQADAILLDFRYATGFDFCKVDRLILTDFDANVASGVQAMGRVTRVGQEHKEVIIDVLLFKHSFDHFLFFSRACETNLTTLNGDTATQLELITQWENKNSRVYKMRQLTRLIAGCTDPNHRLRVEGVTTDQNNDNNNNIEYHDVTIDVVGRGEFRIEIDGVVAKLEARADCENDMMVYFSRDVSPLLYTNCIVTDFIRNTITQRYTRTRHTKLSFSLSRMGNILS